MAGLGTEKTNGVAGHHDPGAGPEQPRQRGLRRQPLLQPMAVDAELQGDPAEKLVGFQQQPIDGFAQQRPGPPGPPLPLGRAVADYPQFVAVQLDHRLHTGGQHPLVIVLVKQVLLADPLGEHRSQLGRQVGRIDVDGERNRR